MNDNSIIYGDCVSCMPLWGGQADLILTDPPFNISVKNNFNTMHGNRHGIDFGDWDKGFDLVGWIPTALDCLRSGGSIIVFNAWRNLGVISDALESCGCQVKQVVQWQRTNPMPRNRDRLYVMPCDFAVWATKGKGWTFNRQKDTYENTIFKYPVPSHKNRIHPTQKPVELLQDLIAIHSNPGDLVLDPFAGSGSTLVAARNMGRRYIGFEINDGFYTAARNRLNSCQ